MRKLKVKFFGKDLFDGVTAEEKMVNFINERNITEDNILKIVYNSNNPQYVLFYYGEE